LSLLKILKLYHRRNKNSPSFPKDNSDNRTQKKWNLKYSFLLKEQTLSLKKVYVVDLGLTSLINASEELKCNNLFIVTLDHEEEIEISGKRIVVKPLWKWLIK